jgi:hypothetical protein
MKKRGIYGTILEHGNDKLRKYMTKEDTSTLGRSDISFVPKDRDDRRTKGRSYPRGGNLPDQGEEILQLPWRLQWTGPTSWDQQ